MNMSKQLIIFLGNVDIYKRFGQIFVLFLNQKNLDINFSLEKISVGIDIRKKRAHAINYIIICARQFIFKNKHRNNIPRFNTFHQYLSYMIQIEKQIALAHDQIEKHQNKWDFV